ncbi:hypothetical protein E2C01_028395 [Portunus trituberculatus]|uniref:Uncharacterized protein n=1 Tax=Portunus trituberculatus TaxID=210409 RepID=A0A5B7ENY2_PORTR|nr:hypothetical protein [Portunus trituberculatus]
MGQKSVWKKMDYCTEHFYSSFSSNIPNLEPILSLEPDFSNTFPPCCFMHEFVNLKFHEVACEATPILLASVLLN